MTRLGSKLCPGGRRFGESQGLAAVALGNAQLHVAAACEGAEGSHGAHWSQDPDARSEFPPTVAVVGKVRFHLEAIPCEFGCSQHVSRAYPLPSAQFSLDSWKVFGSMQRN